jgi:Transposase
MAVAHTLLVIGYYILKNPQGYRELGAGYLEQSHKDQLQRYFVKRVAALGLRVSLENRSAQRLIAIFEEGCDYHPGFQQIASVNSDTGDLSEARLGHKEEAEQFYRDLKTHGVPVRVGMEASRHARWLERLLIELQFELWIGNAAAIRAKRVRKRKTDHQDAQLLLQLLLEDRFPRIWVPDAENRDLRQLLWHRHRLVQMRTRVSSPEQRITGFIWLLRI